MEKIKGFVEPRFESVRDVFAELIETGQDVGGSVAVTVDGKFVVDLYGGWTDENRVHDWSENTLTNVWSMTKSVCALAALVLVERGLLDLDSPVATYWPEFAVAGKEGVLVRHILGHTSGVSGWEQPVEVSDLYNWEVSTSRLARQQPWWEPGTASGYHAMSYGHLIGEIVRRVTGMSIGTFVSQQIAGPLGADFHIGLSDKDLPRVSNNIDFPPAGSIDSSLIDMESVMMRTATGPVPTVESSFTDQWKKAEVPAVNGHGNAHAIVRLQSVISNGGEVDGIRMLSQSTIDRIFESQSSGRDLVVGGEVRWGIGYMLEYFGTPWIPNGRIAFGGGRGGNLVVNDLDRRMTIGFVQNKLFADAIGSPSSEAIMHAVYASL